MTIGDEGRKERGPKTELEATLFMDGPLIMWTVKSFQTSNVFEIIIIVLWQYQI